MRIALVANPMAGGRSAGQRISAVLKRFGTLRIQTTLFETKYPGHACRIVEQLDLHGLDAVVSMGGDGTNYQVLNAMLKRYPDSHPDLGILPCGRGNSFARDLGISSIEDGIAAIARGKPEPVDVCRFTQESESFYFVNLMGLGFVTDVARTAARFGCFGDASYVFGVFHRLARLRFHHLEMEVDGSLISEDNCFVEICNSRYTGGSMLMAPDARIDDGLFDIVIVSPLSRLRLLKAFPGIYRGTHGSEPAVRFVRGRRAVIRTSPNKVLLPDGEIFGSTPTTVTIEPGRVRYFV